MSELFPILVAGWVILADCYRIKRELLGQGIDAKVIS